MYVIRAEPERGQSEGRAVIQSVSYRTLVSLPTDRKINHHQIGKLVGYSVSDVKDFMKVTLVLST